LGNLMLLAAAVALLSGGALVWIVAAAIVLIGGPADEALGDDDSRLSEAQRLFFDASLYATLPLLALITFAMLQMVAIECRTGIAADLPHMLPGMLSGWSIGGWTNIVVAVLLAGYCYAVLGATVGHELTHRTGVTPAYLS